jgi:hypothetical protein
VETALLVLAFCMGFNEADANHGIIRVVLCLRDEL